MSNGRGTMHSLVGMLFCLMVVSGYDKVSKATGFVGGDVLLPCNCSDRNPNMPFRWHTDGVRVVEHTGNTSDFSDDYKDRAKLFLSEDWKSNNCSLLLKNIRPEDEGKYKCSFKEGEGLHNYSFVNLTVSAEPAALNNPSPVPTEPTSPDNLQILWLLIPVALVVVLSLFLFYKRRDSRRLNADEGESAEKIQV